MFRFVACCLAVAALGSLLAVPPAEAAPAVRRPRARAPLASSARRVPVSPARLRVASPRALVPATVEPLKAALEIEGLGSPDDAENVTVALRSLPGVVSAIVDRRTGLAVVDYRPGATTLSQVLVTCKEAGFEAAEYRVESRFPRPIKLKGG